MLFLQAVILGFLYQTAKHIQPALWVFLLPLPLIYLIIYKNILKLKTKLLNPQVLEELRGSYNT